VLVVGVVALCVPASEAEPVVDVAECVVVVVVLAGAVLVTVLAGVLLVTVPSLSYWSSPSTSDPPIRRRGAEERHRLAVVGDRASGEEFGHRVDSDDDRKRE
jgi:hypothetical protein